MYEKFSQSVFHVFVFSYLQKVDVEEISESLRFTSFSCSRSASARTICWLCTIVVAQQSCSIVIIYCKNAIITSGRCLFPSLLIGDRSESFAIRLLAASTWIELWTVWTHTNFPTIIANDCDRREKQKIFELENYDVRFVESPSLWLSKLVPYDFFFNFLHV